MEALSLDDTTSLRLVLSSTRYNSPRSEYDIPFHDYAGKHLVAKNNAGVLFTLFTDTIIYKNYSIAIFITCVFHILFFFYAKIISNPYKMPMRVFSPVIINSALQLISNRSQKMSSVKKISNVVLIIKKYRH